MMMVCRWSTRNTDCDVTAISQDFCEAHAFVDRSSQPWFLRVLQNAAESQKGCRCLSSTHPASVCFGPFLLEPPGDGSGPSHALQVSLACLEAVAPLRLSCNGFLKSESGYLRADQATSPWHSCTWPARFAAQPTLQHLIPSTREGQQ